MGYAPYELDPHGHCPALWDAVLCLLYGGYRSTLRGPAPGLRPALQDQLCRQGKSKRRWMPAHLIGREPEHGRSAATTLIICDERG